jgi:hypothetical protein
MCHFSETLQKSYMGQGLSIHVLDLFETQAISDFYAAKHGKKSKITKTIQVSTKLKSGAKESMNFFSWKYRKFMIIS